MRLIEQHGEDHFSEGEPDLEPPEELAVGELDDETLLEEQLDDEVVLEQDVDDDLLTVTLEDLAHLDDEEEIEVDGALTTAGDAHGVGVVDAGTSEDERLENLEIDELEDLEESLDLLLRQRLAVLDGDGAQPDAPGADADTDAEPSSDAGVPAGSEHVPSPCGADEFVCQGCFLVRLRCQLADERRVLCLDCTS